MLFKVGTLSYNWSTIGTLSNYGSGREPCTAKAFPPRLGVLSGFVFNAVHRGTLPLASPGILDGSLRLARHHTIGSQLVRGLDGPKRAVTLMGTNVLVRIPFVTFSSTALFCSLSLASDSACPTRCLTLAACSGSSGCLALFWLPFWIWYLSFSCLSRGPHQNRTDLFYD